MKLLKLKWQIGMYQDSERFNELARRLILAVELSASVSRIMTRSLLVFPRAISSSLPPADQAKFKIRPDLNSVIGDGAVPSTGRRQRFGVPPRVVTAVRLFPSGDQ